MFLINLRLLMSKLSELLEAAENGNIVKLLCPDGNKKILNTRYDIHGNAVSIAVNNNKVEILQSLLDQGIDIDDLKFPIKNSNIKYDFRYVKIRTYYYTCKFRYQKSIIPSASLR